MDKATSAFPEYADKIRGEAQLTQQYSQTYGLYSAQIVVDETRVISDEEYVNYVEYSNGVSVTSIFASADCS